jgi:hypothetical protein
MRPRTLVVGLALTATLALVALPGLAGSRASRPSEPVPVGAFQPLPPTGNGARPAIAVDGLDTAFAGEGAVTSETTFIEPGQPLKGGPTIRPIVDQPDGTSRSVRKPEKYKLTGTATFYEAGYTAMRLPRGTIVIICGGGGCVERVVNDYGPQTESRIVDLYKPDFFDICGCPSWSGTTEVTVYVY